MSISDLREEQYLVPGGGSFGLSIISMELMGSTPVCSRRAFGGPTSVTTIVKSYVYRFSERMIYIIGLESSLGPVGIRFTDINSLGRTVTRPERLFGSDVLDGTTDVVLVRYRPSKGMFPDGTSAVVASHVGGLYRLVKVPLVSRVVINKSGHRFFDFERGNVVSGPGVALDASCQALSVGSPLMTRRKGTE